MHRPAQLLWKTYRWPCTLTVACIFSAHATAASGQLPSGAPTQRGYIPGQHPPFVPGQSNAAPTPSEYAAYSAAVASSPASAQEGALQNFLQTYPLSSLAPQARRLLMIARMQGMKPDAAAPGASSPPRVSSIASPTSTIMAPVGPRQESLPSQEPAHPAVIEIAPHSLTIRANNSSLSQIFHDLSATNNMTVQGLGRDERIYGSFGPGEPRDVILALIDGLNYNVLMVGESKTGVPRQIILSPRAMETAQQQGAVRAPDAEQDDEATQDDQSPVPQPVQGRAYMPPNAPGPGNGALTREQMLEQLRRANSQNDAQPVDQPK